MIRLELVILLMALAVSLLGFIPLFPWLENFSRVFLPGAMLVRLLAERMGFRLPSRLLTAGSLGLFLVYLLRITRADIAGPMVNLLVLLLGVRFLGERSGRNYLQLFLLALFCLAASSLYSLDPLFMLYLGLQLLLFPVALVLLVCYDRDPSITLTLARFRSLVFIPLAMLTVSIPLLLGFFVILPRTPVPLWDFLADPAGKKSGFSETVQPGSASTVGESKVVAFRVECDRLAPQELYWRGITLNRFDGSVWSRREPPAGERFVPGAGRPVPQRFFLEPVSSRYLVALELPGEVTTLRGVTRWPDFTLSRRSPSGKRSSYEVGSFVGGIARGRLGLERRFYLETPERLSPWLQRQGERLRLAGATDADRLAAVEALFRAERLVYSTTSLPVSGEPLVEFLTVKKRGNCEFFASSCGVLLRLAGIPARLVGGYQGGEYNDLGGYYLVTEERAHVWVEAYLEGKGWVRVDPSRWAINDGETGRGARQERFRSLRMATDMVTYFWNRQVITYDLERQLTLFHEAGRHLQGVGSFRWRRAGGVSLLLFLPLLCWWGGRWLRQRPSPEERLVAAFKWQLRKGYGVEASPDMGLQELIAGIVAPDVLRFVELYGGCIYRDRRLGPKEREELRKIIGRMKSG